MRKKAKQVFSSDIGKSISSGYLLFFINNIVALFLTPYILQFISKEEYGLYILCVDFLAWMSFLEFGTNKVIESKAGHLIANKDHKGLNRSFNTSFYFQIIVAIIILPFFYVLVQSGIGNSDLMHVNVIIILFSVSAALSVFRNLYSALIIANKKNHLDNKITLLNNILNYVLILLVVPFIGVVGLAIINVLTVILVLMRSSYRVKQLFPQIKLNKAFFEKEELKSLFSLGLYFSLGSVATLLLMKVDSYIIGKDFGFEQVAFFYITIKLFTLTQKIFQMFLNNFRPHISQFYGKKEFSKIYSFFTIISPISLAVIAFCIAIAMIINKYFINFWVGQEFFLSNEFSILFGLWVLLELHTITSRVILISSLYNIKWISFFRLFEAICRISIIILFLTSGGINILPISSVIACILLGNLFFHFQIRNYFKKNDIELKSYVILYPISLVISVFILLYNNLIDYFPYLLLCSSVIFGVFSILNNKTKIKSLSFILK